MILSFGPGLVVAGVVVFALAVILDNRDLRRARRAGTLSSHRAALRDHDEDRETAA